MTDNEQHIENLKKLKSFHNGSYGASVNAAIKALKQEPCDDAISRDAVFNAIEHEDKWLLAAKGHNGLTEIAFSGLKARVDALPSVNPQEPCDKCEVGNSCLYCKHEFEPQESGAKMEVSE